MNTYVMNVDRIHIADWKNENFYQGKLVACQQSRLYLQKRMGGHIIKISICFSECRPFQNTLFVFFQTQYNWSSEPSKAVRTPPRKRLDCTQWILLNQRHPLWRVCGWYMDGIHMLLSFQQQLHIPSSPPNYQYGGAWPHLQPILQVFTSK